MDADGNGSGLPRMKAVGASMTRWLTLPVVVIGGAAIQSALENRARARARRLTTATVGNRIIHPIALTAVNLQRAYDEWTHNALGPDPDWEQWLHEHRWQVRRLRFAGRIDWYLLLPLRRFRDWCRLRVLP